MITQVFSRILQGPCTTGLLVATMLLLIGSAAPTVAQSRESTDRENPVRLTSGDFTNSVSPDREIYYTFMVNPGLLTVSLNVLRETGIAQASVELFDNKANPLTFQHGYAAFNVLATPSTGRNEQQIQSVQIARRQPLLLRIKSNGFGKYRVRLSGAIDLPGATPSPTTPPPSTAQASSGRGKLRIEMNDGTVQEIDLSSVRQVSVRP